MTAKTVSRQRHRNPDDDRPADFAARRAAYYQELGQPTDADTFITGLQQAMTEALATLDRGLSTNPDVRLVQRSSARTPSAPHP